MCTPPSGTWTWPRQGFSGELSALQLPVCNPSAHTHTLHVMQKNKHPGRYQCQASLGFLWVGASPSLSLTTHGLPEPHSTGQACASFTHFCCVLLFLAIPAPVRCSIYVEETFQKDVCVCCSGTGMPFRQICCPYLIIASVFVCYVPLLLWVHLSLNLQIVLLICWLINLCDPRFLLKDLLSP